MPTGYTHGVQTGEIVEFNDFAMRCARAFGALIDMRDDPMDTKIHEIRPGDYHLNEAAAARLALAELAKLGDEDVFEACAEEYKKAVDWRAEYIREKEVYHARYKEMLRKASAWNPPTHDHEELKNFMISQLSESIRSDCSTDYLPEEPKALTPTQWLNEKREKLTREIAYHEKQYAEDVERCATRNAWVRALMASLKATTPNSQIEEPRSGDEVDPAA